ncbi:hypothetical protein SNL152K_8478 [Streptomyces sp. NL15-2K]|nr:hypothetical protein SNL152K_8478 [Streptomyces sp. NL15-2K]
MVPGCALVEHALTPSSLPLRAAGTGGTPARTGTHRAGSPPRHVQRMTLRWKALPV